MNMSKADNRFDPSELNEPSKSIIWFDDFNEVEGKQASNGYRFLSNFYVGDPISLSELTWDDEAETPIMFQTGEHAFQALKALDEAEFTEIADAPNPSQAKKLGRSCQLRPDWEAVKFDVMMLVLRSKFTLERPEGEWLLETGTALLTEGTYWGDQVWGVDLQQPGRPGRNWLGTLLMARRAELVADRDHNYRNDTAKHNLIKALG